MLIHKTFPIFSFNLAMDDPRIANMLVHFPGIARIGLASSFQLNAS